MKIAQQAQSGSDGARKFALEIMAALLIGVLLLAMNARGVYRTSMNVPFFKNFKPDLLIIRVAAQSRGPIRWRSSAFFGFLILVLVGSSNAVNLTDGLDGLAIGLMVIAAGAMTALSFLSGNADFARYLELARTPGASELTIFCGAMTGASLGFLWYNAHPAEVFMGDVGSLALGGGLGVVAVLLKQEVLLLFIGGVFVIEAVSVILQVGSFKLRGKRIFKMAPLHHHFEQMGWQESKVIARFWIVGLDPGAVRVDDVETEMKLEGAKVVVVGMARSGVAAVELLREKGARVRAVDQKSGGLRSRAADGSRPSPMRN